MAVYRGVVKGNLVVLQDDVQLPDGTAVEVRAVVTAEQPAEELRAESLFKQRLLESGLITEIRLPGPTAPAGDRTPATVRGRPLSEAIVEERR